MQDPNGCYVSEPKAACPRGTTQSSGLPYVSRLTSVGQSNVHLCHVRAFKFSLSANLVFSSEYYAQWRRDSESELAFVFVAAQHKEVIPCGRFRSKDTDSPGCGATHLGYKRCNVDS